MEYRGIVSGIGDAQLRANEITSDNLATTRNYMIGYDGKFSDIIGGVIKDADHDFDLSVDLNNAGGIRISDGMAIAYGYVGWCDTTLFNILLPAVEQYHFVYIEFDNSVIPNRFTVKIKNNQSSPNYDTAFRQDVLLSIKTGVFQLPLWRIKLTNQGVSEVTDLRALLGKIERVYHADVTDSVAIRLESGVTCVTQAAEDTSHRVANTEFVCSEIKRAIAK